MKKIIAYLLAVCLLTLSVVPAAAIQPYNLNTGTTSVWTEGINNVDSEQAEMLKSLGLFLGTNNGFELDKILTRAEAAALIVRFMGEEASAIEQQNPHPYDSSDVTRADDGLYTITLDDTLYILSETEVVTREIVEGTVLHKTVGGLTIYTSADGDTFTITASTLDTAEVVDTYTIDLTDPKLDRDAPLLLYNELYGEAGYFEVHDGRLIRITDRPTLDVSGVRVGAIGEPIVLTHAPDEYYGSEIYQYSYYDYPLTPDSEITETVRLSNDIPHGIIIDSIEGRDSSVWFYSRQPLGMEKYNTYSYSLWNGGIYVQSFTSDRMEMLEHNIQWYIDTEQQRLTDLGLYNP